MFFSCSFCSSERFSLMDRPRLVDSNAVSKFHSLTGGFSFTDLGIFSNMTSYSFFPIIMDGKKLYEEMLTKMPKSVNEKPSPSEWNLLTAFKSTPVGRNIIEQMSEEQVKWCEETIGLPYFDEKK